ncbi:hypothetical protein RRG08_060578 [Elysia crispata]|uniref:Uncharacterized protein n=1 Tax=Elysia crispata TaxID=231223 RepID=A0AAE1E1W0_9GAST|nr:hypothetical protein RRG08_060578 [Elysia crispata]
MRKVTNIGLVEALKVGSLYYVDWRQLGVIYSRGRAVICEQGSVIPPHLRAYCPCLGMAPPADQASAHSRYQEILQELRSTRCHHGVTTG